MSDIGMVAGAALNTGLGLLLEGHNDRRQLRQQEALNRQQLEVNKDQMDYERELQMQMWNETNYAAQLEHMKKAGLSAGLMYGMGGAGGTTTGGGSGGGNAPAGNAPAGGQEIMGLQLMGAQKELIEAQTEKTQAEANKTAGVDTKKTETETENNVLQGIILKYSGKEAAEQFKIKQALRSVEINTIEAEMSARQGLAWTTWELWKDGKLSEKALNEVEQTELQNAKTREEKIKIMKEVEALEVAIKGGKLENMLKEAEIELNKIGIDKNSPNYLRIIGRLITAVTQGN